MGVNTVENIVIRVEHSKITHTQSVIAYTLIDGGTRRGGSLGANPDRQDFIAETRKFLDLMHRNDKKYIISIDETTDPDLKRLAREVAAEI